MKTFVKKKWRIFNPHSDPVGGFQQMEGLKVRGIDSGHWQAGGIGKRQKKAAGWGGPLPTTFPRLQLQHADNEIKAEICNSPLHE